MIDYMHVRIKTLHIYIAVFGYKLERRDLTELFGMTNCDFWDDFWRGVVKRELEIMYVRMIVAMNVLI